MGIIFYVIFMLGLTNVNCQRVPPGVPPQHYQQPPPQYQQHAHPSQQYPQQNLPPQQYQQQQQQTQYQQVPVQTQQQVPVQQVPQGHGGGHQTPHGHHGQQQVLNAANIQHEREHIQEHIQVPIDTSKMSETELQFHYFKMHDSDNNNKLDGCELIKSLIHWHADDSNTNGEKKKEKKDTDEKKGSIYTDDTLASIVDMVLDSMDSNKDGFIEYAEYRVNNKNIKI